MRRGTWTAATCSLPHVQRPRARTARSYATKTPARPCIVRTLVATLQVRITILVFHFRTDYFRLVLSGRRATCSGLADKCVAPPVSRSISEIGSQPTRPPDPTVTWVRAYWLLCPLVYSQPLLLLAPAIIEFPDDYLAWNVVLPLRSTLLANNVNVSRSSNCSAYSFLCQKYVAYKLL
jgi:hypothetical protein